MRKKGKAEALAGSGACRRRSGGAAAPEVAAGRLNEHALADILMTAHPHPPETTGLVLMRERPLHQLATPPL